MIEFNQSIKDKDYKKAFALHYFSYKYTYITPILGIIFLVITVFNLSTKNHIESKDLVMLPLCLFLIIRPLIYVQNYFNSVKTNKSANRQTKYTITDNNKIIIEDGDNNSTIDMKDLHAYYDKGGFIFLYQARNLFFLIDKKVINVGQIEKIIFLLNQQGIKKI